VGREQRGTRPAVVIASRGYLAAVPELAIVVPATTRDRDWAHHVRLARAATTATETDTGDDRKASDDQLHTNHRSRQRVESGCLHQVVRWLDDFVHHA